MHSYLWICLSQGSVQSRNWNCTKQNANLRQQKLFFIPLGTRLDWKENILAFIFIVIMKSVISIFMKWLISITMKLPLSSSCSPESFSCVCGQGSSPRGHSWERFLIAKVSQWEGSFAHGWSRRFHCSSGILQMLLNILCMYRRGLA